MPKNNLAVFQVSLKVLLVNNKKEYLILKTFSRNKFFHDKYDLPGGRINQDEFKIDFHKLIDREIKEEVGKDVKYKLRPDPVSISKRRYPEKDGGRLFILFEAKYLKGEIKLSNEHIEYHWKKLNKNNIKNFILGEEDLMLNYFKWNKA